jgi:hypothetical protein
MWVTICVPLVIGAIAHVPQRMPVDFDAARVLGLACGSLWRSLSLRRRISR